MKNKKIFLTIGLMMGLFLAPMYESFYENPKLISKESRNLVNDGVTSNALYQLESISLNGNSQIDGYFSTLGIGGDGLTFETAYVLENWIISAEDTINIEIQNADRYVIIQNCILKYGDPAIYIDNCENIIITGNSIEDSETSGIEIIGYCANLTISENTFENCNDGIRIEDHSNSIIIANNDILHNRQYGIYIYDSCVNINITENTISSSEIEDSAYGIYLYSHCDNINILDNLISGSELYDSSTGIYLDQYCDNNTIANNVISNQKLYGINLNSYNVDTIITQNTISDGSFDSTYLGIRVSYSDGTNLTENNVEGNYHEAVQIRYSDDVLFKNNILTAGGLDVNQASWPFLIDDSNTANGGIIYYNRSGSDLVVDGAITNYGQVILFYCDDSIVKNLAIQNVSYGLYIYDCGNITVVDNQVSSCGKGFYFYSTIDSRIENNHFSENDEYGLYTYYCDDNNFTTNTMQSNTGNGLYVDHSDSNQFNGNIIDHNGEHGIRVYYSDDNNFTSNILEQNALISNEKNGIEVYYSDDNRFTENSFSQSGYVGINLNTGSERNYLAGNQFANDGIMITGEINSGNIVLRDNLVNGNPLFYNESAPGLVIDGSVSDYGQVLLINCSNFQIINLESPNCPVGLGIFNSENGTISNCAFEDNLVGIVLMNLQNITLSNCNVERSVETNLLALNVQNGVITDSTFESAGLHGAMLTGFGDGKFLNNIIRYSAVDGIWGTSSNINFTGNQIYGNGDCGLFLDDCDYSNLTSNTIYQNEDYGIELGDSEYCNLTANSFFGNENSGVYLTNSPNCQIIENMIYQNENSGIHLDGSNYCYLISNEIYMNGNYGFCLDSSSWCNLSLNNVYQNDNYGLYLISSSSYNVLIENNIHFNEETGIYIGASAHNDILRNSITSNRDYQIKVDNGCSGTFNISENTVVASSSEYPAIYCGGPDLIFLRNTLTKGGLKVFRTNTITIDHSNTVNGKLLLFNVSINHWSFDASITPIGQLILFDSVNVSISNVNIADCFTGIEIGNCYNISLSSCTTSNNYLHGIYVETSMYIYIDSCTSSNNAQYGILLEDSKYCAIEDSTMSFNQVMDEDGYVATTGYGIYLEDADYNNLIGNRMSNNTYGIYLDQSEYCIVSNNVANGNQIYGIRLYYSEYGIVTGNTASLNRDDGFYIYYSDHCEISGNTAILNGDEGFYIYQSEYSYISDNSAILNEDFGYYIGYCEYSSISGNIATSNEDDGIYIRYCEYSSISGNTASSNEDYGLYIYDSSSSEIVSNHISDNVDYGIYINNGNNYHITGNIFTNDGLFLASSFINTIVESNNLVNGIPIYYRYGEKDLVIDGSIAQYGQIILVDCEDSTISNLNIASTDIGIYLESCNNIDVSFNEITDSMQGIGFESIANSSISENNFIQTEYSIFGEDFSNCSITLNNCTDQDTGIYVLEGDLSDINNNSIQNSDSYGIHLNDGTNMTILNNYVYNSSISGIDLRYLINSTLKNNKISAIGGIRIHWSNLNEISSNWVNDSAFGVYIMSSHNNSLINNTILNSFFYGMVLTESTYNSLVGNFISVSGNSGLFLQYCDNNSISENIISYADDGIFLIISSSNFIFDNILSDCRDWAIYLSFDCLYNEIYNNTIYISSYEGKGINDEGESNTIEDTTDKKGSLDDSFWQKNGIWFGIGGVALTGGVAAVILIIKKKRSI